MPTYLVGKYTFGLSQSKDKLMMRLSVLLVVNSAIPPSRGLQEVRRKRVYLHRYPRALDKGKTLYFAGAWGFLWHTNHGRFIARLLKSMPSSGLSNGEKYDEWPAWRCPSCCWHPISYLCSTLKSGVIVSTKSMKLATNKTAIPVMHARGRPFGPVIKAG